MPPSSSSVLYHVFFLSGSLLYRIIKLFFAVFQIHYLDASLVVTYSAQGNAQRPEVRVVTWNNDELATDALPINGFEHYKENDYSLAHAPFSGKLIFLPFLQKVKLP